MKTLSIIVVVLLAANLSALGADDKRSPQSAAAASGDFLTHLNGGVSLAQAGKIEAAIVELKKAAAIKPDDQLVLVNLGQAYQLAGKNLEALVEYKRYLSLYPKGSHVAQITGMFKAMQAQVLLTGGRGSQGMDNYLAEAASPGGARWDDSQMPLRVFVDSGAGVEGYKDEFPEILKKAFADWCEAAQGKIRVAYVEEAQKANIVCKWTANVKDLANPAEGGQAFVQMMSQPRAIIKADLLLLTHNASVPASVEPASYMRLICLHEIGHALGLAGHSSQPGDVMFSVMNYGSAARELSERDKKTMLALYSPGNASPSGSPVAVPIIVPVRPGQPSNQEKHNQGQR